MRTWGFPSLIAAIVCAAVAVLAGPGHAVGAYPGSNGQVVFSSSQTGHRHIYITTAAGSITDLTAVSSSTAIDADPRFSPDGQRIAFTRSASGLPGTEIFVMSPDGKNLTQLTNTPLGNDNPTWSPDGTKIAFISHRNGNIPNIFIMNADGTDVQQITRDTSEKTDLAWSPKGDRLAFVRTVTNVAPDIYTVKVDGTGLTDLTNSPSVFESAPAYSPDGSQIVYGGGLHPTGSVGGDLWIMNSDGSNIHALQHETNGYSDGNFPAWSPDGTRIAFGANNGSGYYHLWSVPATGGENTELVTNKVPGGNPVDQETDWQPLGAALPAPTLLPPVLGRSVDVRPVAGRVLIKFPPGAGPSRFVALSQAEQIPLGSVLDLRHGTVALTSAAGKGTLTYSGSFRGAGVKLTQQARGKSRGLTTLTLIDKGIPGIAQCRVKAPRMPARVSRAAPTSRVLQTLRSHVKGRFRTRGRFSAATVRGTIWDVSDRCDGTLTVVHRGVVLVTDFVHHRTVKVTAGQRYLATAR